MSESTNRRPIGVWILFGFFVFGTLVSLGSSLALALPKSVFGMIWCLKPEARLQFESMVNLGRVLLASVAIACGFAAAGLYFRKSWAVPVAVGILAVNLLGDVANAILRSDVRTLFGIPIGGAMIAYLLSRKARRYFGAD